ncbi:MAG: helix-turn-helix transcriptional regulator [Ruminococcaceae bacterium]|nr:helix-turn-helix transcriptional regulator [Oscillospiraceae bacterium]
MAKELGEKLKQLRELSGFTQENIGKLLSVDRSTYSNYERSVTEPDVSTLKKLAKVFSVDLNFLLSSNDVPVKVSDIKGVKTYNMNPDEKKCIAAFRLLSEEQQAKTIEYMHSFIKGNK